jgi:hypothetical protein
MFYFDCTLSLEELHGAIVTLGPTFLFILVNPIPWWFTVISCYT